MICKATIQTVDVCAGLGSDCAIEGPSHPLDDCLGLSDIPIQIDTNVGVSCEVNRGILHF